MVFAVMFVRQLDFWPGRGAEPIDLVRWALLTLLTLLFWSAYWRRRPAIALANRPIQVLLPLVCSAVPLAQYPPTAVVQWIDLHWAGGSALLFRPQLPPQPLFGLSLMAVGEAIALVGMLSLGRSFSIFSEVRELVTSGLYRFVRHPLYLGEILAVWGYLIAWPAPWGMAAALLFTALQSWRAQIEEARLLEHHPAYAAYRERAGFLWPRFGRRG